MANEGFNFVLKYSEQKTGESSEITNQQFTVKSPDEAESMTKTLMERIHQGGKLAGGEKTYIYLGFEPA